MTPECSVRLGLQAFLNVIPSGIEYKCTHLKTDVPSKDSPLKLRFPKAYPRIFQFLFFIFMVSYLQALSSVIAFC